MYVCVYTYIYMYIHIYVYVYIYVYVMVQRVACVQTLQGELPFMILQETNYPEESLFFYGCNWSLSHSQSIECSGCLPLRVSVIIRKC